MNFPPLPFVPEFLRGQSFVMIRGCFVGPQEGGERLLAYWREWQSPTIDEFKEIPFSRAAEISQDPVDPIAGKLTGGWLTDLSSETAEALIKFTLPQGGPPAIAFTEIRLAGGAVDCVDPSSSAYSHRHERLIWGSLAPLPYPGAETMVTAHFTQLRAALGSHLTGKSYMNFLEGDEAAQRTAEGYSPENLSRLREIKSRYDPSDLFRFGYQF